MLREIMQLLGPYWIILAGILLLGVFAAIDAWLWPGRPYDNRLSDRGHGYGRRWHKGQGRW